MRRHDLLGIAIATGLAALTTSPAPGQEQDATAPPGETDLTLDFTSHPAETDATLSSKKWIGSRSAICMNRS